MGLPTVTVVGEQLKAVKIAGIVSLVVGVPAFRTPNWQGAMAWEGRGGMVGHRKISFCLSLEQSFEE
jgi:hypothetical protein